MSTREARKQSPFWEGFWFGLNPLNSIHYLLGWLRPKRRKAPTP